MQGCACRGHTLGGLRSCWSRCCPPRRLCRCSPVSPAPNGPLAVPPVVVRSHAVPPPPCSLCPLRKELTPHKEKQKEEMKNEKKFYILENSFLIPVHRLVNSTELANSFHEMKCCRHQCGDVAGNRIPGTPVNCQPLSNVTLTPYTPYTALTQNQKKVEEGRRRRRKP